MSQYIEFYIKHNDDFIYFYSYCRSSEVYHVANRRVPYEKISRLDQNWFSTVINELNKLETNYQFQIKKYQDKIKLIAKMPNNTIDEKLDCINDYQNSIDELNEELDSLKRQIIEMEFISCLDAPVYAGVEAGENPEIAE